ncbi:hypothetical protein BpHYR1_010142 [Brachionus plicatilis]|uniref:Uncharacterized protein n=1 Tax=Brachionus plicatilis TaxID=10195 RepID=A0A3M7R9C0_BRAPC|nr:hypothetical protein BpHYR1_010142 [Brachionus plicatilis]
MFKQFVFIGVTKLLVAFELGLDLRLLLNFESIIFFLIRYYICMFSFLHKSFYSNLGIFYFLNVFIFLLIP